MKKNIILTALFTLLYINNSVAQNYWTVVKNTEKIDGVKKIIPTKSLSYQLNDASFFALQSIVPLGYTTNLPSIQLPSPDGTFSTFQLFENPVMEDKLAQTYKNIKTYTAINVDNKAIVAKLDYTNYGFHAMVLNDPRGSYFIDPITNKNTGFYNVYFKKDYYKPMSEQMVCGVKEPNDIEPTGAININNQLPALTGMYKTNGDSIKTYRLALACTGEYAVAVAGPNPTRANVLSAMVTSVNRVTGVYELEFAVHLNLVANDSLIIYLDGTTDPYIDSSATNMINANTPNINAVIGSANYDIGHVFSTGGGGLASLGCVCGSSKASAVTGSPNPVGDPFDIDYVAHEMGHEFGGSHTFNAATGSCGGGNRSKQNAYEVGSGTTIMAYAGICGANDVQPHSDAFFTIRSMVNIDAFIKGNGLPCAAITLSNNTTPVMSPIALNYYIPFKTFFEVTGSATDANNDPISYCWEEYDKDNNNTGANWNDALNTVDPLFKSYMPTSSPTRIFSDLNSALSHNINHIGARLADTARTIRLKLTVRDVHNGYGSHQYADDTLKLFVQTTPTLFRVTSQSTAVSYTGNTTQTVTWDNAGTNTGLINTPFVDIYVSIDSGKSFPYKVADSVANNGTASIVLPNMSTTKARIKVKGHGNVFFDINPINFTIVADGASAISSVDIAGINIYPNPANTLINIDATKALTPITKVQLINTLGQLCYESNMQNKLEINIATLPKGMYILKLMDNKNEFGFKKLIVQ